ncbi:LysR family transcriptional regulator [Ferrimonas marina]|uniref:DNA-binding transcriptional regulator, LysR family n=1 Tax=Ferrimonas marina TaxID=299255 RepID=A0A1M5MPG6_9GAMM|nr:LysR family transcriptional regulator [Ferrimonas marina]SHG79294.1 DNA-binding transcriptional regulator, LysR family [Ferrimonas marina]
MKGKEITNLYWFCQSVAHGSFAAASAAIHVSAPTLSRAVAGLEETLGEKLIHRNAKQFQLTAAGEAYYQRFSPLYRQLDEEWDAVASRQSALTGEIRISCPEPFADRFLQPAAIEFMAQHPGVRVAIEFASDTQAFFNDQIDLAIATHPPKAPDLVQRKLFQPELALAAAPDYLQRVGTPDSVEDLLSHQLLAGNKLEYWDFIENGEPVRLPITPKYAIDSIRLVLQAASQGLGICLVPKATMAPLVEQGLLQPVLPEVQVMSVPIYLVWADRKLVSARVRAFRAMLEQQLGDDHAFLKRIATADEADDKNGES